MKYEVFTALDDGSDEKRKIMHHDAPCWGRLGEGFFPALAPRHVSRVIWHPQVRLGADGGLVDTDEVLSVLNLFIRDFGDGEFTILYPERQNESIRLEIKTSDCPRAVTLLKLFVIRNILEYVGNAVMYKYLVQKGIPNRLAMYVGAATTVSYGVFGRDMNTITMYTNDAQVHDPSATYADLRRFLYPRKGKGRQAPVAMNGIAHFNPNSTFREAKTGYRKGTVIKSIRNGKPSHNTKIAPNNLYLNNWTAVNAFLSKMLRRDVEVTPQ